MRLAVRQAVRHHLLVIQEKTQEVGTESHYIQLLQTRIKKMRMLRIIDWSKSLQLQNRGLKVRLMMLWKRLLPTL